MRTTAFDVVYGTLERDGHSGERFHAAVEGRKLQEKAFLRRLSYGTIERAITCDAVIESFTDIPVRRMEPEIRTILRMGTYELLYMDAVPASATCDEMVKLAGKKGQRRLTGFVNGVLRNIARTDKDKRMEEILAGKKKTEQKLSVQYAMPEEVVAMLVQSYGKKTTKKILSSFLEERPVTIRIQTMNATVEEVRKELEAAGVSVSDAAYMENGLRLYHAGEIDRLPGFSEGHFTVQDESSMLPVVVAGLQPGDRVLDVCSSPGGKTFHALDVLNGNGFVSARDQSPYKLERIRENAVRLRAADKSLEIKVWDAAVPDEEWRGRADVVLVDVPCSGIGVIGKKPEIKYHAIKNAGELVRLQKSIVRGAADALKPGGTLVYSTCTVNPPENEEMAAWIEKELALMPVPLDEFLPEKLRNGMTRRGMLQMLPGVQEGDGFFVAKFKSR